MSVFKTNLDLNEIKKNTDDVNRYLAGIHALESYIYYGYGAAQKIQNDFQSLEEKYLNKLTFHPFERVQNLVNAITLNQTFLNEVIRTHKPDASFYQNIDKQTIEYLSYSEYSNLIGAIFLYLYRDWTADTKEERDKNYKPIVEEIKKYCKEGAKVLIPGCAQCRLGYEIAKNGNFVESNEYNYTNAMICDYFLNNAKQKDQFVYQPLVYTFLNYLTEDATFEKCTFPDEDIDLNAIKRMNLIIGDFTKIYKETDKKFDCVVTCFFIDTAKNVLEYIEIIDKVLNDGGIWINFGPLSYHFVWGNDPSIELPYDLLKDCIKNYGFEFLNEDTNRVISYCHRENFLKNEVFRCIFFTCRKGKKSK